METNKIDARIAKIIGFLGCILLTLFSIVAAVISLTCLVLIFIEGDCYNIIASVAFAFIACIGWSIRKDTLV